MPEPKAITFNIFSTSFSFSQFIRKTMIFFHALKGLFFDECNTHPIIMYICMHVCKYVHMNFIHKALRFATHVTVNHTANQKRSSPTLFSKCEQTSSDDYRSRTRALFSGLTYHGFLLAASVGRNRVNHSSYHCKA